MGNNNTFSVKVAAEYGIKEAIIFHHISFWIEKNKISNTNFKDGKYWTYNSISNFAALYDYLTESQIRTI